MNPDPKETKEMTKQEYRAQYIAEMVRQAHLTEDEATETYTALDAKTLHELEMNGDPAYDVGEEISYWTD